MDQDYLYVSEIKLQFIEINLQQWAENSIFVQIHEKETIKQVKAGKAK